MAHTDDCPCQTGPQSPENISHFWHIVKTTHRTSLQRTFVSSGTYDCPCQTGPQSPENISHFWHIVKTTHRTTVFREHLLVLAHTNAMPDRTTVPREHFSFLAHSEDYP